jgi:hypothetical protein
MKLSQLKQLIKEEIKKELDKKELTPKEIKKIYDDLMDDYAKEGRPAFTKGLKSDPKFLKLPKDKQDKLFAWVKHQEAMDR